MVAHYPSLESQVAASLGVKGPKVNGMEQVNTYIERGLSNKLLTFQWILPHLLSPEGHCGSRNERDQLQIC